MRPHRHLSLPLLSALAAAGLLIGLAPSPGQTAPFYHRWERAFPDHWELPWYRPRKHVRREAPRRNVARGPLLIAVSIAHQDAKIFSGTTEVAAAPVSTGVADHPTPTGVFAIIQKQIYHESNIYSAAPMPHMQRLTWSGIALHGGVVPGHPASHGCIRFPRDFAVRLYGMTKRGTRVVVTYDEAVPIEIVHKALLQPKQLQPSTPDPKTAALDIEPASKTADVPQSDVTPSVSGSAIITPAPVQDQPVSNARQRGALSIFISRKQQKLYARYNFTPLFDIPISISNPENPIGTHVFTATESADSGKSIRWNAVSIPSSDPKRAKTHVKARIRQRHRNAVVVTEAAAVPSAAEALDRIDIPPNVRERVADLLAPGASLIISDNAPSEETGTDTDFVVLTP